MRKQHRKTLVHEFHILYVRTECNFLLSFSSLCGNTDIFWKLSAVAVKVEMKNKSCWCSSISLPANSDTFNCSDEVQIGPETVMTVLYTAKKYAVPALERRCVDFLKNHLSPDNAFMLLTQVRDSGYV